MIAGLETTLTRESHTALPYKIRVPYKASGILWPELFSGNGLIRRAGYYGLLSHYFRLWEVFTFSDTACFEHIECRINRYGYARSSLPDNPLENGQGQYIQYCCESDVFRLYNGVTFVGSII